MNVWAHMNADSIVTCGSHTDTHVATMQDQNGKWLWFENEMHAANLIDDH